MDYETESGSEMGMDGGGEMMEKPAASEETFFLPEKFLASQGKEYGPGDTVSLKVVGKDADGDLEVVCVKEPGGDEKDWKTDLRETMTEKV